MEEGQNHSQVHGRICSFAIGQKSIERAKARATARTKALALTLALSLPFYVIAKMQIQP